VSLVFTDNVYEVDNDKLLSLKIRFTPWYLEKGKFEVNVQYPKGCDSVGALGEPVEAIEEALAEMRRHIEREVIWANKKLNYLNLKIEEIISAIRTSEV